MHIPDGYLSPGTCVLMYAAMTPVWYLSSRRAEKTLGLKRMPALALGAAFSFVIMMFNVPAPGGTSGHMSGGVVLAATLGPWAAVVAMTIVLALQALVFGDGGITTLGANSFNMAFVACFSGYYVYRAAAVASPGTPRASVAAAAAGYTAANLSALAAAVELGVQPLIAAGADGRPLYAPYGLGVTLPAMMIPHVFFFGPVEALGTALVISRLRRTGSLPAHAPSGGGAIWAAIALLVVLAPLGLMAAGAPWGEWSAGEVEALIGFIPDGMKALDGAWKGVLPDYGLPGVNGGLGGVLLYMASAAIGSATIVLMIFVAAWCLGRFKGRETKRKGRRTGDGA
jgi:cobalt/nickel transport system permease protein